MFSTPLIHPLLPIVAKNERKKIQNKISKKKIVEIKAWKEILQRIFIWVFMSNTQRVSD